MQSTSPPPSPSPSSPASLSRQLRASRSSDHMTHVSSAQTGAWIPKSWHDGSSPDALLPSSLETCEESSETANFGYQTGGQPSDSLPNIPGSPTIVPLNGYVCVDNSSTYTYHEHLYAAYTYQQDTNNFGGHASQLPGPVTPRFGIDASNALHSSSANGLLNQSYGGQIDQSYYTSPPVQPSFQQNAVMPSFAPLQSNAIQQRTFCPWLGCTESFIRSTDVARHVDSVHLGIKYHCFWVGCPNNGGKGYCRLEKLRTHQRQKHGFALM